MNPPDIARVDWGTPRAITESAMAKELIEPVDGVELLPIRNAALAESIAPAPNPLTYVHYWGYMPRDESFSAQKGGPEGIIDLVDWAHSHGKLVIEDDVLQHTANQGADAYTWLLRDGYAACDITGCGNTINSSPGSVPARLMRDRVRRDLSVVKLDGTRFDLFGAIHRDTAQSLTDSIHSLGGEVSGEPYGYPYDQSYWTNRQNPVREAGLWDHDFYRRAREMARGGGVRNELLANIAGLNADRSLAPTWYSTFGDRTAIVETHDGETLSSYQGGNLKRVALAQALQFSAQGKILIGPGQLVAYRHPYLDNSPVDLFNLSPEQEGFKRFSLSFLKLRRNHRGYFAFKDAAQLREKAEILSATDEQHGTPSNHSAGLLIRGPAPGFEATDSDPLLMLLNFSDRHVRFRLPSSRPDRAGTWDTVADSNMIRATPTGSLYPPASAGDYIVAPFSIAWLRPTR